jgi:hypothetical protein
MTHTKDETLRIALEALEKLKRAFFKNASTAKEIEQGCDRGYEDYEAEFVEPALKAITAIKQARLAPVQPVQEPVAWWVTQMDTDGKIDSFAVTSDYDYAKSVCDLDIATPRPLIFGDTTPPAQPAPIPDAITDNSESPEFRSGWNECRELTIQMRKP